MSRPEVVPVTPDDDAFHPVSDHPYETETFWASFHVPERGLGGWFYNQVLFNQQVCNGGAWVWDPSPAPSLYEVFEHGLPLDDPVSLDLRDVQLPNGNHLQALEPLRRYRVRYSDPGRFEADVILEGLRPPHSHPLGVPPFWKGRHLDQAIHVTGQVVLHDEVIDVDSLSMRDRSWGPRPGPRKPEGAGGPGGAGSSKARPRREPPDPVAAGRPPFSPFGVGYVFGTASAEDLFLAYTLPSIHDGAGRDDVTTGYLVRDGEYGLLVGGSRHAELDPEHGWMRRIVLEAVDEHGREVTATGTLVSHHGASGLGTGYFHWEWDGAEGYGEDQSAAPQPVVDALLDAGCWSVGA